LLGASLGAVYSTWMGFSAGRMASIVKSSPQFKSAQKQLALDSIDLSKSGLDSESGIQFHGKILLAICLHARQVPVRDGAAQHSLGNGMV